MNTLDSAYSTSSSFRYATGMTIYHDPNKEPEKHWVELEHYHQDRAASRAESSASKYWENKKINVNFKKRQPTVRRRYNARTELQIQSDRNRRYREDIQRVQNNFQHNFMLNDQTQEQQEQREDNVYSCPDDYDRSDHHHHHHHRRNHHHHHRHNYQYDDHQHHHNHHRRHRSSRRSPSKLERQVSTKNAIETQTEDIFEPNSFNLLVQWGLFKLINYKWMTKLVKSRSVGKKGKKLVWFKEYYTYTYNGGDYVIRCNQSTGDVDSVHYTELMRGIDYVLLPNYRTMQQTFEYQVDPTKGIIKVNLESGEELNTEWQKGWVNVKGEKRPTKWIYSRNRQLWYQVDIENESIIGKPKNKLELTNYLKKQNRV